MVLVTVRCDGDDDLAGDLGAHVVVAESDVGGVSVSEGGGGNGMVSSGNGVVGVVGHDGLGGVGHGVGVGHRGGNRVASYVASKVATPVVSSSNHIAAPVSAY